MILVKPSFEILTRLDGFDADDPFEIIEMAGRLCYKSELKKDWKQTKKFVSNLIKRGHESVIEHFNITVKFIVDRGVTHELVRHRLAAYSQECLSGDTIVRGGRLNLSLKRIYERQARFKFDKTHNKTIHLRSMNENGEIIPNKISKIWFSGVKPCYKVETELGYSIECTKNHRFLGDEFSFKELEFFKEGDLVFVNGRPSLLKVNDSVLSKMYLEDGLNPLEISENFHAPYSTILRRLKKLGVFVSHKNDDGWRKLMSEIQLGECNSNWNGGPKKHILAQRLKRDVNQCELCGENSCRLETHHKDRNADNNEIPNLIKCCVHCHNLLHHGWYIGRRIIGDKIKSIEYVGEKETYDLEMFQPYDNFVANGFVVHNSTRYCNYKGGVTFVIPPWVNIEPGEYPMDSVLHSGDVGLITWAKHMWDSEADYIRLSSLGWTPQQARSVLPNSLKTEIVMTANLREWRHVLKLRTSQAAHPQMREIMIPLLVKFKNRISVMFDDIGTENEN